MKRHTKIICTLGPASCTEPVVTKMARRGMDVARINFSHGTRDERQKLIDVVREVNRGYGFSVKILQDLEGYRIRIGRMKRPLSLQQDEIYFMSSGEPQGNNHIPFDYQGDIKSIAKGDNIFIDDGKIHLRIMGYDGRRLKVKVVQGGVLKERKGINILGLKLQANILTQKDKDDLEFGIKSNVDKIAQSFVRNKKDILRIVDIVKSKLPACKIIAKIESKEGVRNIDSIIDSCDGIMVARGDLGVSYPIYQVPLLQKYLIRRCCRKKKFVITATQMLDSMIDDGRPTRAEVSDVANAILDGTDYVMLSGETAVGKYPSRSIQMMRQIIEYTEQYEGFHP